MSKRDEELTGFVREGLARGIPKADLKSSLLDAGWRVEHIDAALASYSDVEFPIPVPTPKQYISAREAFLYLVLFTTLYIAACAMGNLLFRFIEQGFPDPLRPDVGSDKSIRLSMSFLIVALPTFAFTAHRVNRMLTLDPTKIGSPTRKWLTYVALFIAAAFLIGDFVTLVYWVLGGELTVRFLLKVAVVALISGSIFGYYLHDLRRDDGSE